MISIPFVITKKALIIVVVVVAIGGLFAYRIVTNISEDIPKRESLRPRIVEVASVAALSQGAASLSLLGTVVSQSEVTIRSEAQGEIRALYVREGQSISRGQVLAEIENAAQRAAVLQAKGAVEAAQAGLSITELQTQNAGDLLAEAKKQSLVTLDAAFNAADDAVRNKADQFFVDPTTSSPELTFLVSNQQLAVDLEWGRFVIENMLNAWNESLKEVDTDSNLLSYLDAAQENLTLVSNFLDDAAQAVNALSANSSLAQGTIDGWRAGVSAARSSVNASLSAVSSAIDNLNSKQTAYEVSLRQGSEGSSEALVGRAQLTQALGALQQAEAALAKTIIRSPISGTLNDLSIERGDFVSLFADIAVVSNNTALEIRAFVTEEDRGAVPVGSPVLIEGKYEGVVAEVSPALDSRTKKIEVTIAITDPAADFINGESVRADVVREEVHANTTHELSVPIAALKVRPQDVVVFTVGSDSTLIAHTVDLGPLIGEKIILLSGVSPDMEIVVDARGLKAGQEVEIR